VPLPGEVVLAHSMILLDERPQSRPHVLKVLRQPRDEVF
jgi:predicted ATPase with chaperone activity